MNGLDNLLNSLSRAVDLPVDTIKTLIENLHLTDAGTYDALVREYGIYHFLTNMSEMGGALVVLMVLVGIVGFLSLVEQENFFTISYIKISMIILLSMTIVGWIAGSMIPFVAPHINIIYELLNIGGN